MDAGRATAASAEGRAAAPLSSAKHNKRQQVWLSWSSGKDCSYTLHVLRQRKDVEVVGLLTTVNEQFDRVAMHAVRAQLLQQQAAAVGLPVHKVGVLDCVPGALCARWVCWEASGGE